MDDARDALAREQDDQIGSGADHDTELTSRRGLIRMGAIGVAAVGAAAAGAALRPTPAGAATGNPLVVGQTTTATHQADTTELSGGPLYVGNDSHSLRLAAIVGDNAAGPGVFGSAGGQYIGVEGQALGQTPGAIGMVGTGVVGVQGITNGTTVAAGPGVLGVGNAKGVGLQAQNSEGASLLLEPFGSTTLPVSSVVGQFIVLSDGSLHYSRLDGAWGPLNGTVQIDPVRVIDTTNGTGGITGPLAPGSTVHTSSVIAGGNGIPAAAKGIVGNFAISGVDGALLTGYGVATIFPAGAATPATSSINAGAGCFAISNGVSVAFGSAGNAGQLSMVWGGGGPVPHAHAFLDVTAYVY